MEQDVQRFRQKRLLVHITLTWKMEGGGGGGRKKRSEEEGRQLIEMGQIIEMGKKPIDNRPGTKEELGFFVMQLTATKTERRQACLHQLDCKQQQQFV